MPPLVEVMQPSALDMNLLQQRQVPLAAETTQVAVQYRFGLFHHIPAEDPYAFRVQTRFIGYLHIIHYALVFID